MNGLGGHKARIQKLNEVKSTIPLKKKRIETRMEKAQKRFLVMK